MKQAKWIVQYRPLQKILLIVSFLFITLITEAKVPVLTGEDLAAPPPRIIRTCCSFGANLGIAGIPFVKKTDITSIGEIGPHTYMGSNMEGNGNIYTRYGGFIDLGHLRDCADWTAWLYCRIKADYQNNKHESIDLGNEGGAKTLELHLKEIQGNIDTLQLAGKIAYDLSLWHEIATWFGASYVPLLPERYSSFSPEDLYSNLLGVHIAMQAIKSDLEYDDAMTTFISETLSSLECVTTYYDTYAAMEKVNHLWWTSEKKLPSKNVLLKRYLDSSKELKPWLIPDKEDATEPFLLNKPDASLTKDYKLTIRVNYKFPLKAIPITRSHRIITQNDFGTLLNYIQEELVLLDAKNSYHNQKRDMEKTKIE